MLATLSIDPAERISVTIAGRLTCRCPVNQRRDYATVEVAYTPNGAVVELESFGAYLGSFANRDAAHEMVTVEIGHEIHEATGADDITVRTVWEPVEGVACVVTATR